MAQYFCPYIVYIFIDQRGSAVTHNIWKSREIVYIDGEVGAGAPSGGRMWDLGWRRERSIDVGTGKREGMEEGMEGEKRRLFVFLESCRDVTEPRLHQHLLVVCACVCAFVCVCLCVCLCIHVYACARLCGKSFSTQGNTGCQLHRTHTIMPSQNYWSVWYKTSRNTGGGVHSRSHPRTTLKRGIDSIQKRVVWDGCTLFLYITPNCTLLYSESWIPYSQHAVTGKEVAINPRREVILQST